MPYYLRFFPAGLLNNNTGFSIHNQQNNNFSMKPSGF